MKIKILIVFLILLFSIPANADINVMVIGGETVGGSCALLQDSFEDSDGVDITTYGWTADGSDPGNYIEIDTAQAQSGSSSVLFSGNTDDTYYVYKTFTQQSSGTFSVTFYGRIANAGSPNMHLWINDGTGLDVSTDTCTAIRFSGNDIEYRSGGSWTDVPGYGAISVDTWYKVRVDLNMDANTFDVTIDDAGSPDADDIAFQANVDPSRIYLVIISSNSQNAWMDELCVE